MHKVGHFYSSNRFNVVMNIFAGNLFPLDENVESLSVVKIICALFMWSMRITYLWTALLGSLYLSNLSMTDILKRCGAMAVLITEMLVPTFYFNFRRKRLRRMIKKYNRIFIDTDDLKRCIRDTIRPYNKSLKFYLGACIVVACSWSSAPTIRVLKRENNFTYADLTMPAYMPGEPFGPKIFVVGIIFQIFGSLCIQFGKISIDLYVINFIAILTSQYKYVGEQVCKALSDDDGPKDDSVVLAGLSQCIRHHAAVIEVGESLTKLLAFHIGASYLTCILKFCFLAYGVITFGSANIEKVAYLLYVTACIVQVFVLCSSIQDLLTESTNVTKYAFHENWYARGKAVKNTFCTIEVSNQMECRLSAWRIVDLIVPTLALILSKSYSVCLLLLKVN